MLNGRRFKSSEKSALSTPDQTKQECSEASSELDKANYDEQNYNDAMVQEENYILNTDDSDQHGEGFNLEASIYLAITMIIIALPKLSLI